MKKKVNLKNGSLIGLSDGAQMDTISSLVELFDNAEDNFASLIKLIRNNSSKTVTILSKEITDLSIDQSDKLFDLGVSTKLKTKPNGVGKYGQGFKYACSNLIGGGNKGQVIVGVRPNNGEDWHAIQEIDYTDDNDYHDNEYTVDYGVESIDMPDDFNFMVKIVGCKILSDKEIFNLAVKLGLRYRKKIQNGDTVIKIETIEENGEKSEMIVTPQDRLYSHLGEKVDYHAPVYLPWGDNQNAATFEYSDMCYTEIPNTSLIDYDNPVGSRGKSKGVAVTKRSAVEISFKGVTLIDEGVIENLTGAQLQPSGTPFRARLDILDEKMLDEYVRGGNKSKCEVDPSFKDDSRTREIRIAISNAYNLIINRHKNLFEDKAYFEPELLNKWCELNERDSMFVFSKDLPNVEPFFYDENTDRIVINVNNVLFNDFIPTNKKSENSISLFIIAIVKDCDLSDSKLILKKLRNFKNICEENEFIG